MPDNKLYYGDNLDILREYIPNESVDLIYLDPPFNSSRSYNVLFKDESGRASDAQITAFEDTWHWEKTAVRTFEDLLTEAPQAVGAAISAMETIIGHNQMMAYLVMMTARLVELHRVLKPTGSLYLHCDPTASHYLKIILDTIFEPENFLNEIIWKRSYGHGDSKKSMGRAHDTILLYVKTKKYVMNGFYHEHTEDYLSTFFTHSDERGRYKHENLNSPNPRPNLVYSYKGYAPPENGWRVSLKKMEELDADNRLYFPDKKDGRIKRKVYLNELEGQPMTDLWTDIAGLSAHDKERLGYPTQKPVSLLERIIEASSNPGDVVLDPFCGCGTAIAAAQKLGRRWIGIDITFLSIALMQSRLLGMYELKDKTDYDVIGVPVDLNGAKALAGQKDRYQFQWWALTLVKAQPLGGQAGSKEGKKGADKGIDGIIPFVDSVKGKRERREVLVQVKSGHVQRTDIADLARAVEREKAAIGVFITLEAPTKPMRDEALSAGYYRSEGWNTDYPKVQILTVEELLHGKRVEMPQTRGGFKQAERVKTSDSEQVPLFGDEE